MLLTTFHDATPRIITAQVIAMNWIDIITVSMGYSLLIHSLLFGGELIATAVVGLGIIWESVEYSKETHRLARNLVIWGIIAETVCSLSLFTFDEGISYVQQARIIALETRLAPRNISTGQEADIGRRLTQFAGKRISVVSYVLDVEADALCKQIMHAIELGQLIPYDLRATKVPYGPPATGLFISGPDDALVRLLISSFNENGIAASDKAPAEAVYGVITGFAAIEPEPKPDATILVGVKPLMD
jgi:hypothetical protein